MATQTTVPPSVTTARTDDRAAPVSAGKFLAAPGMNSRVIDAIFRRNFISYFSSPTGYVFICLFVLLTSLAAFFPNDFFVNNLANLDQLNFWIPWILLLFIPTITMSIWADERRLGTDELLLTIPASDLDVVIGKYLAGVAIYTVSLLFSLTCTYIVLESLGDPDIGLFLANYFGYWLMGLAMLAIGMVASFITGNLTVAFVLGVLFNGPLVVLALASNYYTDAQITATLKEWSMEGQFRDFARGVVSLPVIFYYVSIVALMLYVCMVLIGRRHWLGGRDGKSMLGHYMIRTFALVGVVVALNWMSTRVPARFDATQERLSTLSADTKDLLRNLDPNRPVKIEAFVSPTVPEAYVQQRLNLLSFLREFERLGGENIDVRVYEVEPATEAALRAERVYDIKPQRVTVEDRGALREQELFLGVAFTSGLQKVVVPFFDQTLPVEYELARSVAVVNQSKRKKVGVLKTDAELFGGFDFAGGMPRNRPEQQIVTELKKQYDVVQVDPTNPITDKYDVLLAVQPSSLNPQQMTNFVEAVRSGQATAIFEDPQPIWFQGVPGTSQPKRPPQQMMMFGGAPPEPKGDIHQLWKLLGVELHSRGGLMGAAEPVIVWQRYNPHPKIAELAQLFREFVFVDRHIPGTGSDAFNPEHSATANLQEVLFPFAGAVKKTSASAAGTDFLPWIKLGGTLLSGTVAASELQQVTDPRDLDQIERPSPETFVMVARVESRADKRAAKPGAAKEKTPSKDDAGKGDAGKDADPAASQPPSTINALVVADIDLMHDEFFRMRANMHPDFAVRFDNVTFVLNAIDALAGEDRFFEVRNKRAEHRPLKAVEDKMEEIRTNAENTIQELKDTNERSEQEFETAMKKSIEKFEKRIQDLQSGEASTRDLMLARTELQLQTNVEAGRLQANREKLKQDAERRVRELNRQVSIELRKIQDRYKFQAVFWPPIPPLLVALFVYFNRRAKEREGVSRSRLR